MTKDFRAILSGAKLPEATVHLCLRGDITAEVERLDAELEHLQKRPTTSLAGSGTAALVEQIERLQDEMREHTYPVRMRALTRAAWRELMLAHPPREVDGEVNAEDRVTGANRETVFEPLVRLSIVDPELSEADWKQLVDKLTDRQYEELVRAAWELNQGTVDIPFSRAALRAHRITSGE